MRRKEALLPMSQDTIDPEWNVRSLREGTIPFSNSALAAERLSLMTSGSSPIGFPSVPLPQLKDDGKITHLDHYHFESKEPM